MVFLSILLLITFSLIIFMVVIEIRRARRFEDDREEEENARPLEEKRPEDYGAVARRRPREAEPRENSLGGV